MVGGEELLRGRRKMSFRSARFGYGNERKSRGKELTLKEMEVEKEERWRDGNGGRTMARRIARCGREFRRRGVILNIDESWQVGLVG